MEEYQDCLKRARRLAVACEATLAGSDSAMSVVTMEDLLIYTRWLICMLHSVKAMHAFIRVSQPCLEFRRVGQTPVEQGQIVRLAARPNVISSLDRKETNICPPNRLIFDSTYMYWRRAKPEMFTRLIFDTFESLLSLKSNLSAVSCILWVFCPFLLNNICPVGDSQVNLVGHCQTVMLNSQCETTGPNSFIRFRMVAKCMALVMYTIWDSG